MSNLTCPICSNNLKDINRYQYNDDFTKFCSNIKKHFYAINIRNDEVIKLKLVLHKDVVYNVLIDYEKKYTRIWIGDRNHNPQNDFFINKAVYLKPSEEFILNKIKTFLVMS